MSAQTANGLDSERQPLLGTQSLSPEEICSIPVFPLIHRIRKDIVTAVDVPLTWEQLHSPKVLFSIVMPLEEAYIKIQNLSTVYCLLVCRIHFLNSQRSLSLFSVNHTRAMLAEILAIKIVTHVNRVDATDTGLLRLAHVLAAAFSPFQGAPKSVLHERAQRGEDMPGPNGRGRGCALEMAIMGEAKNFIRSMPCQRVVEGIYKGRITYSASTMMDLLPDYHKRRPIALYNPSKAPFLNHYRLVVPALRGKLEWAHFLILFISFIFMVEYKEVEILNGVELWWIIYGLGYSLDQIASIVEHGWRIYVASLWNGFDLGFLAVFFVYLIFRIIGLAKEDDSWTMLSHDVVAVLSCILFPRLAFVSSADSMLVLGLRAMLAEFFFLLLLAVWCFGGFWYALSVLGRDNFGPYNIAEMMTLLWFGLDGQGIISAKQFHPVIGPFLFVAFACLANTLLLTVLVSILSNTFSKISADSVSESMYRRTVSVFEHVKVDAIFGYQPPFNLLALLVMLPAKQILSPRWFHKVNVFSVRLLSLPILLGISFVERRKQRLARKRDTAYNGPTPQSAKLNTSFGSRITRNLRVFESAHSAVEDVFDVDLEVSNDVSRIDETGIPISNQPKPGKYTTHPPNGSGKGRGQEEDRSEDRKDSYDDRRRDRDRDRGSSSTVGFLRRRERTYSQRSRSPSPTNKPPSTTERLLRGGIDVSRRSPRSGSFEEPPKWLRALEEKIESIQETQARMEAAIGNLQVDAPGNVDETD